MLHVLELNDWQFRLMSESADEAYDQPAAVSAVSGNLVFGDAAQAAARTQPQQYSSQYLNRLNADPLPASLGAARNHADLIYHHLRAIDIDQRIAISVASHVSNQQLGLLLGIAKEAKVAVAGFIDTALAYSLDLPLAPSAHVLDVELHRAALTQVVTVDGERRTGVNRTFTALGAMGIVDGWLNVIADEFVQKTRFDPLHAAATEQQLLDQVLGWLVQDRLSARQIAVTSGEQVRDIEVDAALLQGKLLQRLETVDLDDVHQLVITPRARRIPGLRQLLVERVDEVVDADDDRYKQALFGLGERLAHDRIERISAAPTTSRQTSTQQAADNAVQATHLLLGNTAVSVRSAALQRYFDADGRALAGVHINDRAGAGRAPRPGDQVVLGDHTYLAITVD